jgi:hypothetical protein
LLRLLLALCLLHLLQPYRMTKTLPSRRGVCLSSINNNSNNVKALQPDTDEEDGPAAIDDNVNAPVGAMPTVSSRINFPEDDSRSRVVHDLWVCGAGNIGEEVIKAWKRLGGGDRIVAETMSSSRHESLSSLGASAVTRSARSAADERTARTVVIAIPPSAGKGRGQEYDYHSGYLEELSEATRLWAGPLGGGSLVFTSSVGVYGDMARTVTENTMTDSRSKKATK